MLTKFKPAEIIGTHLDLPHMILEITYNDINELHELRGYYRLLDLNTGQRGYLSADTVDTYCSNIVDLPNNMKSHDGYYRVKNCELRWITAAQ